jgi:hypothetical protein
MMTHSQWHIGTFVLLPLIVGMTVGGKNVLRNGDFEKFTGDEPDAWTTTNIPKTLTVVSATTGQHGKSAVKCEVKAFYGTPIAGMIIQKNVPLNGVDASLSGSYKFAAVGGDVGYATMEMRNAEGSSVRVCQEYLQPTAGAWKVFTLSGSIPSGVVSGELRLTILAGKGGDSVHEGSVILFDDVSVVVEEEGKSG